MQSLIKVILVISPVIYVIGANDKNDSSSTKLCQQPEDDGWCLTENYDPKIDPFQFKEKSHSPLPWNYTFDLVILEISDVDDIRQRISFLMYFRMEWHDPRLHINLNSTEWKTKNGDLKKYLFIPLATPVWYPDLEIFGLRKFGSEKILTESGDLRVKPGEIFYISRYADVSITCMMDFSKFPFDRQTCDFLIGSYSKANDIVTCRGGATIADDIHPQRSLQYDVTWKSKSLKKVHTFSMGSWEYCGFRVQLDRITTKYFVEAYAPSFFFVVLSWISFIIKPDAIPGRIMLLLNIFLVLIILMNNAKESTPDVNRINAIDVYIAACNIHVFFAILEYAILLLIMKCYDLEWKKWSYREKLGVLKNKWNVTEVKEVNTSNTLAADAKDVTSTKKETTSLYNFITYLSVSSFYHLDWISSIMIPFSFIVFNIYYWNNL